MRLLTWRFGGLIRMRESTHEELTRARNVNVDIAVHRVFREQVNTKLLAGLCEPQEPVKSQNIGEYAATFIMVDQLEEFPRRFFGVRLYDAVFGGRAIVVDVGVLVMEGFVKDTSSQTGFREHPFDKGLEFDEAVI